MAMVATVGTTSTTSIDPVREIAAITREYGIWLHVDAAYAGIAAIVPELRVLLDGVELADSLVVNPHKWMFVPMDCSALFVKDESILRRAFSIVPEFVLTTSESGVVNYMEYGLQLGRRFRALKLWFVLRHLGRGRHSREAPQPYCVRAGVRRMGARANRSGRSSRRIPCPPSVSVTPHAIATSRSSNRSTSRSLRRSMRPAKFSSLTPKSTAATRSALQSETCARSVATSSAPGKF